MSDPGIDPIERTGRPPIACGPWRGIGVGMNTPHANPHLFPTVRRALGLAAGFALAFLSVAQARDPSVASSAGLRTGDQHLLRNLMERTEQNLAAAELAQNQAHNPQIRRFAGTLAERDEALKRALDGFAGTHDFVAGITAQERSKWTDELRTTRSSAFDGKYLGRAIDSHEELLGALKETADDADSAQLRSLAQHHVRQYSDLVDEAEELKGSL